MSEPAAGSASFLQELDTLVRARYPLIQLVSWEEQRLETMLQQLASRHGKTLMAWSITRGLRRIGGARTPALQASIESTQSPLAMLEAVRGLADPNQPSLVVLHDFHPYLSEPNVVRALRELAQGLKSSYTTVILLSPTLNVPVELEKELTVLDVPLPTFSDLHALLRDIVSTLRKSGGAKVELKGSEAEALIKAALGLTLGEAENAFAKAIATDGRLDGNDVQAVMDEKRQVIRKSGLLEYYPLDESLDDVGGLAGLKHWLSRRQTAFGEAARRFGLPEPKGLLLLGVQGCGKSLTAKAIAAQWRLPLLRLDLGRIFSGLVGSSEENLRKAIRVAESVAPAILWVDEIEKGLAGAGNGGTLDGGVTARVFGGFLTWLQEKRAPVFVVATANRIDALPPELLRQGRFDEIFFIDLPSAEERREVLAIHLRRRKREPAQYDLARLSGLSEGFSGAELEGAVVAGLYEAFAEGTDLTQAHIETVLRQTRPLAITMREEVERLRGWARDRTRSASQHAV